MIRTLSILAVLLCALEALAAPHVLRVRALGEPQTLDWNRASTWIEGFVIRNLMEGLVSIDAKLNAVPALAQRWSVSPDHKLYIFHLRKGVRWSDGIPLRAQDFVASWKRLLSPSTSARYASLLFDIEGAEAFHKGRIKDFSQVGVTAIDESTLQVKLQVPISYWYWTPTFYATYPIRQDLIEKHPKDWYAPGLMPTVGPYSLQAYEAGRKIKLRRNPDYYGRRGNLDEVDIALVHDDSTALKLYEGEQLDFLSKIPSRDRNRLKGRADLYTWPDLRTIHLRFNTKQNPSSNLALRKAIAMSIDRSKLTKLFENSYQPATAFVPMGMMGYTKHAGVSFDPDRAKTLLKGAGFDAAKLPPLDLLTVAFDDQIILAQFIQDEVKRNLGVNIRIHILEPKRYYSPTLNHSDYAMQINFWGADYPDADNFYSIFLSNSGLNRYAWSNDRYDALVLAARSQVERKDREKSYLSAQKILLEDSVVTVPLYYGRISGLLRKNVQGFNPGPLNWWSFKDLSVR